MGRWGSESERERENGEVSKGKGLWREGGKRRETMMILRWRKRRMGVAL